MLLDSGDGPQYSGPVRSMQRPELMRLVKVDDDGARACGGDVRKKTRTKGQG